MIDLSNLAHQQHHHVGLPQEFQLDLQWWASFLPTWNGKSILHQPDLQHVIMADASGTWGFGSQRQMVSDPAAKGVGRVPHCCKGTGSGGHGFSVIARPPPAVNHSAGAFRQQSCRGRIDLRHSTGPGIDAYIALSAFLSGSSRHSPRS